MIKWIITGLMMLIFLMVEPAIAQMKYGSARIQTGELTVVRNEVESLYVPEDGEVEILLNDLLRVGKDSFVILSTNEQTDIKMGSNAIFQIKPWKSRNKTGYVRMLYGKMNFKTEKLENRRRFSFKTASATIGVRGTGADCEVGSTGNTGCIGRSGNTVIQGNSGPPQELTANLMSIVAGNQPASQVMEVVPETSAGGEKDESKAYEKPAAGASGSSTLSREQDAVSSGVVSQEALDESKRNDVSVDEPLDQELQQQAAGPAEEEAEADEAFEENLKQSDENATVAELEVSAAPEVPDLGGIGGLGGRVPEPPVVGIQNEIEDAVQESKNAKSRLRLEFSK